MSSRHELLRQCLNDMLSLAPFSLLDHFLIWKYGDMEFLIMIWKFYTCIIARTWLPDAQYFVYESYVHIYINLYVYVCISQWMHCSISFTCNHLTMSLKKYIESTFVKFVLMCNFLKFYADCNLSVKLNQYEICYKIC